MDNIKVLIITYYWPPSGGAGVQRWVKLTKYLGRYNITPYVLTVDEKYASYMQIDASLTSDVADYVSVNKTKSFEPINYYAKIVGQKNVPTAGFSNVDNDKLGQKIVTSLRSNLFIPDPRKGWNKYAYRKAVEIIRKENIQVVITSSPPHSTQLIGLKLRKNLKIKWIADLRDPWTDIYYYKLLGHSLLSKARDRHFEKRVLVEADKIITVSEKLKEMFYGKDTRVDPDKIHVVPNGYDHADFDGLRKRENETYTICYTGTMSDAYEPSVFLNALRQLVDFYPKVDIKLQLVGNISESIKVEITKIGLNVELIPTVPHDEVIGYQVNADLLLLIIPNVQNAEGILTGKLFEYLATGSSIVCIGPESGDAAKIIERCHAGKTFNRASEDVVVEFLKDCISRFLEHKKNQVNQSEVEKYSRSRQANEIREIVDGLLNESESMMS